jgi:hypothetical protein
VKEEIDEALWDECRAIAGEPTPLDEDSLPFHIGDIDGLKILLVNGNKVKTSRPELMDFNQAGNGFGWEVGLIPKGEVWVDSTTKRDQDKFNLYHEFYEIRLMKLGLSYEKAHVRANIHERILRKRWGNFGDDYKEND